MEAEKKRKKNKNKNKKNTQAAIPTKSVPLNSIESTSDGQSHVQEIGQSNNDQELGTVDASNDVSVHVNADRDGNPANCTEAKNKKKKDKQAAKPTESVPLNLTESTSDSQSHVQELGQSNNDQELGTVDASNDVSVHLNADRDDHPANCTEANSLAEAQKHWLDREAAFEDKIKELQAEKDAQIQKEALLEERIKQLMKENEKNSEKEASLEEKIKQLHDEKNGSMRNEANLMEKLVQLEKEKDAIIQKEGSLEQKIQQLQREIDAHVQKKASLETQIMQLEDEKDSWFKKEASFEAKINQLADEAALLNLKVVSLEEKIKQMEKVRDSCILKENSANQSIACLTIDYTKLQAQVIELEQSRENLLNETQHLKETISILQLRINNLEMENKVTSEDGDAKYQLEAARALVDNLIAENSKLVEKVNMLNAMLDQRGVRTAKFDTVQGAVAAQSTTNGPEMTPDLAVGANDRHVATHASDPIPEASRAIPASSSTQSLEDVMVEDQRNGELVNADDSPGISDSSEIIEVGDEIVQIPLDENEMEDTNSEVTQNDEEIDVSLTDAPLIGAPFRFISFVASYVSGADLVSKNTGKSG